MGTADGVTAQANLGFPAGRKKTCLIDLENVFLPGTPHKLRLRTNLEVYWDSIEWAQGLPQTRLTDHPIGSVARPIFIIADTRS